MSSKRHIVRKDCDLLEFPFNARSRFIHPRIASIFMTHSELPNIFAG